MKKLTIALSDEAHLELLKIQLQRKSEKSERTTLVDVASDVLNDYLIKLSKQKEQK